MREPAEPGKLGAWILAARPKTLPVAVVPVVVGSAIAFAETTMFSMSVAVIAMLCALLIQIGTNLHNDVSDFERGADDPATRLGPRRATAEGWLQPAVVSRAAAVSFASAFFIGLYLVAIGGWPILLLGIISITAGYAYSGGPRPIAYTCFGEAFVLAFFGLAAVGGTYYLQASGLLTGAAMLGGIAIGLPAAAVLVVNNTRDLDEDRCAGRRTFPVVFGKSASRIEYAGFMFASLLLAWATAWRLGAGAWAAVCLVMLPWAYRLCRRFRMASDPNDFNELLAATARFGLSLGAVLAFVLVVTNR
ncbi:MAG: 1,4-dihydroxy-2-naphthoate polyprenyltransferase [Gammaproteobacteria bacterium]|nr:MAG: 1,4-dihydroxy-2-naphthoate polyprenyltransferase [Gammaproteobacteria bacterium]